MNGEGTRYSIDASALIDGWRRFYSPDVIPSLWERLEQLVADHRLIAPVEVLIELERGGDDLFAWASEREAMFMEPTEPIQARVTAIVNAYPDFIERRSTDGVWADPYVIAVAQETNGIVITGECSSQPNERRLRIPNVCSALDVECFYTDSDHRPGIQTLMRRESWRF